jgi:hypothetical protein
LEGVEDVQRIVAYRRPFLDGSYWIPGS